MCLLQINRENKECLHCGKGAAAYCEKCYQDLISENAKLQLKIELKNSVIKQIQQRNCDAIKFLEHNYNNFEDGTTMDLETIEILKGNHIPRID